MGIFSRKSSKSISMSGSQSYNSSNQSPGYPSTGPNQGYVPSYPSTPGYPHGAPTSGYPPPNSGYPPCGGPGYPQPGAVVPGYPPSGVPGTGYPPSGAPGTGYPPGATGTGYPPSGAPGTGYPPSYPQGGGYPSGSGYPTQGGPPGSYSSASGYPPQSSGPGYPSIGSGQGYPTPSYPPGGFAPGYPPSNPGAPTYPPGNMNVNKPQTPGNPQKSSIRPTLTPAPNFNPDTDASQLFAAFKGIGCNKTKVINVIARRSSSQRDLIAKSYMKLYSKSLIDRTKSELSMNFEIAVLGLLYVGPDSDAYFLYRSMKGVGTVDSLLCEIITSRSHQQLTMINNSYNKLFSKSLENDVVGDTSGVYRDGLLRLIKAPRETNPTNDRNLATADSSILVSKSSYRPFTEESSMVDIFCKRSYSQLKLMFTVYEEMNRKSILTLIDGCFSKDTKRLLKYIYHFVVDPNFFVCQNLRHAIKKNKPIQLSATVITRSEIDLGSAIDMYNSKFGNFITDVGRQFGSFESDIVKLITILTGNG